MADCPECGRLLDDGECTRCGFKAGGEVETAEKTDTLETTAKKRPARKAREKN